MPLNKSVTVNSTSNMVWVRAFDTATGIPKTGLLFSEAGLLVNTSLNNGAMTSIGTLITATEGTFTSLGFKESTNVRGLYQIGMLNTRYSAAGSLLVAPQATSTSWYFREELVDITTDDGYAAGLTENGIADALLNRDMSVGTDSGSTTFRTMRQALRTLRNYWFVVGSTATFTKEDDATPSHTAVLAGTPTVTSANPAGGA